MNDMAFKISYVRVRAKDLQTAREFYEEVLDLPLITVNVERGYCLFDISGIMLIVETQAPKGLELPVGRYLGISLKTRNIQKVYSRLKEWGVKFTHPPKKQFWGGYLTEFYDPDGNLWTLLG